MTRPIARRRARDLFRLCAGFVHSQVLAACVELRVFAILAEGPLAADALARRTGLPVAAATRLLRAAAAIDLVEARSGDRYGLGRLGVVLADDPGLVAMIGHHRALYADLADPVALLAGKAGGTALARYWPYSGAADPTAIPAERVADYTQLMAVSQALVGGQLLDAYDLRGHRCLLDVGGGDGSFLAAAAARAPGLRLVLFDLPAVAARARARLEAAGLASRATVVGGNFHIDQLPAGADAISLVRVLHDHDDATVRALLASCRQALPADGVLLIAEPMAGAPRPVPEVDAYFGLYLLAMGRGRPRTPDELAALLREAGFCRAIRIAVPLPLQSGVIVARP